MRNIFFRILAIVSCIAVIATAGISCDKPDSPDKGNGTEHPGGNDTEGRTKDRTVDRVKDKEVNRAETRSQTGRKSL